MEKKLNWFINNKEILSQHFQNKYVSENIDFSTYEIEGIFIINTPTFYMYNSKYRIYTIKQIEEVVLEKIIDPVFQFIKEENGEAKFYNILYPYFRKPIDFTDNIFTQSE